MGSEAAGAAQGSRTEQDGGGHPVMWHPLALEGLLGVYYLSLVVSLFNEAVIGPLKIFMDF